MEETTQPNQLMDKSLKDIPESAWGKLSEKKIYFGHQSVGFNIINGLNDVMKENPQIKLNIVETSDPDMFNSPVFAHSRVGINKDPESKNSAFAEFIEKGIGGKADFAFFKFCYIDIPGGTDVERLFTVYKNTLSHLKKEYPKTTFIHVTVPLVVVQTGVRVWIKKIIGREIRGYEGNIKRNQFNRLLRKQYQGKEPVFDLAQTESTYPDGQKETFRVNDNSYNALVPEYASDGRHLNEMGRRVVAEQLLILLASLSNTMD